jgi:site-specific recombinase XerD
MTNQLFTAPRSLVRLRHGPLAPCHNAYALALHEQGYARQSIRQQVLLIADFSRWLHDKRIAATDIDRPLLDRFLRRRRRQGRITGTDASTLNRLLTMLHETGVAVRREQPATRTARQRVTDAFQFYLLEERGLSQSVARHYVPFADSFLRQRYGDRTPRLSQLRAADVTEFVRRRAYQLRSGHAKNLVTALRSFFRYLYQHGMIATDLSTCVPAVPAWSLSTVTIDDA